jgi:hypothetical protein
LLLKTILRKAVQGTSKNMDKVGIKHNYTPTRKLISELKNTLFGSKFLTKNQRLELYLALPNLT